MLVLQGQVKVDSLAGNEKQARGLIDSLRLGAVWGGRWEDLTQLRTSPADAHSSSSLCQQRGLASPGRDVSKY